MSGFAAIYQREGAPVRRERIQQMLDLVLERGPDQNGCWTTNQVGLGHCALHTTQESLQEQQPHRSECGNYCLTLDGRVDNRSELRVQLEARGWRLRDETDAELVLRAYQSWGVDAPKYIVGDFAFVIWDEREQQLFCARDFIGIRPFYYNVDDQRFIAGSELQQVLRASGIQRKPNEGMVGEYLAGAVTHKEETLFENIYRLPPAHTLTITQTRVIKRNYWQPDVTSEIRYRTNEEYAEHFLELFEKSVTARLRVHGKAGSQLSGGLDSSSVVAMAMNLLQQGKVPDCGFETFSATYPQGWQCEETEYIDAVNQHCKLKGSYTPAIIPGYEHFRDTTRRFLDFADYPNGSGQLQQHYQDVQNKSVKVLLTGIGGNDWFEGNVAQITDNIVRLRFKEFASQISAEMSGQSHGSHLRAIISHGIMPFLPFRLKKKIRQIRHGNEKKSGKLVFLTDSFMQRIELLDRMANDSVHESKMSYRNYMYSLGNGSWALHARELIERNISKHQIELRHPFHDRKLVEFAVKLPSKQTYWLGERRYIVRNAMQDLLPHKVVRRAIQANFSEIFPNVQKKVVLGVPRDVSRIGREGWVSVQDGRPEFLQLLESDRHNEIGNAVSMWSLWACLGIEIWLQEVVE